MEEITIDTIRYVKASSLARELGYTADYVGQLCRAGKVDAKLVGRSWYVNEDSLRDHKGSRYRSTKTKSKEALQKVSERTEKPPVQTPARTSVEQRTPTPSFYRYHQKTPAYAADNSDLIPTVRKDAPKHTTDYQVPVTLAGAEKVKVTKESEPYALTPEERKPLKFKGKIDVHEATAHTTHASAAAPAVKNPHDDGATHITPKLGSFKHQKRSVIEKSKFNEPTTKSKPRSVAGDPQPNNALTVRQIDEVDQRVAVRSTERVVAAAASPANRRGWVGAVALTLLAIVLGTGIVLLEERVTTTVAEGTTKTNSEYTLAVSTLLERIYGLK